MKDHARPRRPRLPRAAWPGPPGVAAMTTILVIDDEPQMLDALEGFLVAEGHDVVTGTTGWQGVELTAETRPDLVILDLRLPDIDGVEVVRRIRTFHPHPVLILSGSNNEAHKVAALDAGADDSLHKPFGAAAPRPGPGPAATAARHAGPTRAGVRRPRDRRRGARGAGGGGAVPRHAHRVAAARGAAEQPRRADLAPSPLPPGVGPGLRRREPSGAADPRAVLATQLGDDAADPQYIRTETGAGYRWLPDGRATPPERGLHTGSRPPKPLGRRSRGLDAQRGTSRTTSTTCSRRCASWSTGRLAEPDGPCAHRTSGEPRRL